MWAMILSKVEQKGVKGSQSAVSVPAFNSSSTLRAFFAAKHVARITLGTCGFGPTGANRSNRIGKAQCFVATTRRKSMKKEALSCPLPLSSWSTPRNETQFYVTSTDGKSAEIWPLSEWEKREAKLAESSDMEDAVRKYLNLTSYYGQQVEIDNQARLLLPQILRNAAKLDGEVNVFGMRTYLEVHNREELEKKLQANEPTAEDRKGRWPRSLKQTSLCRISRVHSRENPQPLRGST